MSVPVAPPGEGGWAGGHPQASLAAMFSSSLVASCHGKTGETAFHEGMWVFCLAVPLPGAPAPATPTPDPPCPAASLMIFKQLPGIPPAWVPLSCCSVVGWAGVGSPRGRQVQNVSLLFLYRKSRSCMPRCRCCWPGACEYWVAMAWGLW